MRRRSAGKRTRHRRTDLPAAATERPAVTAARRNERLLVLMIFCSGVLLRLAWPGRVAVEHFDEGVYASNLWFTQELGYQFHLRHLYAPPLVPALIEASLVIEQLFLRPGGEPSNLALMAPSLFIGCATPVLVWWVTRCWFGSVAAISALTLAAFSDVHALYSRTALTDVIFVFALLLAVWLGDRACSASMPQRIVAAGVGAALAWWAKYNGWLALAILLSGLLAAFLCDPTLRRAWQRHMSCWIGISVVALLCWSPCLYGLQSEGGYAAVAANHRQYLMGLAGWPTSLARQAANLNHFHGWLSHMALAVSVLAGGWLQLTSAPGRGSHRHPCHSYLLVFAAVAAGLAGLVAVCGWALALTLLGLGGVCARLAARGTPLPQRLGHAASNGGAGRSLPAWLLLSWFGGLLLATPLYAPYPRLMLPWLCAAWIGAGLAVQTFVRSIHQSPPTRRGRMLASGWLLAAGALLVSFGPNLAARGIPAWQPRTGMSLVADRINALVQRDLAVQGVPSSRAVVLVYGEPALFYNLKAKSVFAAAPVGDLAAVQSFESANTAVYLATGPHAQRSAQFVEQFSQGEAMFTPVGTVAYSPSDLVLLNQYHPHQLKQKPRPVVEEVQVFRVAG